MYGINNNSSSSSSFLMKEEDDKMVRPSNTKKQTIPVIIYYIKKKLEFINEEIKELNNKLENEFLSDERLGTKIMLSILNQKINVFKNDLIQSNKKINDYIFEYVGRRMFNNDSTCLDDFSFYENVININNVSDILVNEKTHTYSIEKKSSCSYYR
jgi:hypothetical protein